MSDTSEGLWFGMGWGRFHWHELLAGSGRPSLLSRCGMVRPFAHALDKALAQQRANPDGPMIGGLCRRCQYLKLVDRRRAADARWQARSAT
jgi:hypothetical protein